MSNINQIHSTNMSLNDRFTAMASSKVALRPRSIRTSSQDQVATLANRNFLEKLVRKDKLRAALKLKRRSMRTVGGVANNTRANYRVNNGIALKRGSVKALRVAANGRPIKTNSLTRVATMNADLVSIRKRGRSLRRANSVTRLSNRSNSGRRSLLGGAAQRVAQRNLLRIGESVRRGRSRSRSRARIPLATNNPPRRRSQSRSRVVGDEALNNRRGRLRSRSRGHAQALPIQARLGVRQGQRNATARSVSSRGRGRPISNRRQPSLSRRGVVEGRVQKRRQSVSARTRGAPRDVGNRGERFGRTRGRAAVGVARGRSQSRNRGQSRVYGDRQQQQNWAGRSNGRQASGRRGVGKQRRVVPQRNGNQVTKGKQQQEQKPQQRGRSRSRGRGGRVGLNQGKNSPKLCELKDEGE